MKVAFLFPYSQTARFIAARLLESGFDVVFFCPEKLDLESAEDMIFELNILGKGLRIFSFSDFAFENFRAC